MGKTMNKVAKQAASTRTTFVLNRSKPRSVALKALNAKVLGSASELRRELTKPIRGALWISYDKSLTQELLKSVTRPGASLGEAVIVHSLAANSIAALCSCFTHLAFSGDGTFLEPEELTEALQADNRRDLFIGGLVDHSTKTVTLWRGDLESLTVPYSAFPESGDGIKPDFTRVKVTDYGQTIRLGTYEAATDAILYEFDPDYRRRIKKERRASEQSFGASLRRLRSQRGLSRDDFEPEIAAKTVARIEFGEVTKVQKKTLEALAKRLAVSPEEIGSY